MSFPYNIRICQWIWSVHLWGMADIVDGHTQAPGKHLKWDVMCQTQLPSKQCHLFFTIYFVLSRYGEHEHIFSPGLRSGGGHGLIPVHGDPGTGDPAHAPETAVTIPHARARMSAESERKSESDGRKAFRHPRARH